MPKITTTTTSKAPYHEKHNTANTAVTQHSQNRSCVKSRVPNHHYQCPPPLAHDRHSPASPRMGASSSQKSRPETRANSLGSLWQKRTILSIFRPSLGDPLGRAQNVNNPIRFFNTDRDDCFPMMLDGTHPSSLTAHAYSWTLMETH